MHLLVDIGGTNTRVAVAKGLESFDKSETFSTPQSFDEGIVRIVEVSRQLCGEASLEGIVAGAAGPLNKDKTKLLNAPNLRDWIERPLKDALETQLESEVRLFNDADLVGMGEANYGAGRGFGIVAYLTISTGVGGSRIVDGRVDRYTYGFEPGHQLLNGESSFEDLAGGASLMKKYGMRIEDIEDTRMWGEQADVIAVGVHNTIVMWSPDVVVLGGSQMKKVSIDDVKARVKEKMRIFPDVPKIVRGSLGDAGGLWGALGIIALDKDVA